jgi:aerotaxis receptor
MKQNLPVTQHEKIVPPGEILISKTDPQGIIVFANSTFAEISGYGLDELVGQAHNQVRHPDVPPQIFTDLWDTIQRGKPWRGIIKNRCKNGDHYWVDSLVMPMMSEAGICGYLSVRHQARREDIEAAERNYQALRAGKTVARSKWEWLDQLLTIRNGLILGIAFISALLVTGAMTGLSVLGASEKELAAMYSDKVEAGDILGRIKFLMADNRAQVMLGLLHDPGNPLAATHDHPLALHTDAVSAGRNEIDHLWETFRKRNIAPETAMLADAYWAARTGYVKNGLEPMISALNAGNYQEANHLLVDRVNGLYERANHLSDDLIRRLLHDARENYAQERQRHVLYHNIVVTGTIVSLLILAGCGFLFFRGIVKPLNAGIESLGKIARGDLTNKLDIDGRGEIGAFNRSLAMTQAQLQVMLDEIAQGVSRVSMECGMLNTIVRRISDGIDEEHERIYQVTDRHGEAAAAMATLSQHAEAVTLFSDQSTAMAEAARNEFSELLMRMLIIADAIFLFRSQLDEIQGDLHGLLEGDACDATLPDLSSMVRKTEAAIQKITASVTDLGNKIEQDKPWEKALSSSVRATEEISKQLATTARELATETRIQMFTIEAIQHEMKKIASFLVENREAMHGMWQSSANLAGLAAELENTANRFRVE